jgi:hypothetical protein
MLIDPNKEFAMIIPTFSFENENDEIWVRTGRLINIGKVTLLETMQVISDS